MRTLLIICVSILIFGSSQAQMDFFLPGRLDTRTESNGLLDTFSLSFVGNFNFAKAIEGIQQIIVGISNFIDLNVINAGVEILIDRFLPVKQPVIVTTNTIEDTGPASRIDYNVEGNESQQNEAWLNDEKKEVLKTEVTTVVGAILNKQQCWERTMCSMGRRSRNFAAKDIFFLMAEKFVPSLNETVALMRFGAQGINDCQRFNCSPENQDE